MVFSGTAAQDGVCDRRECVAEEDGRAGHDGGEPLSRLTRVGDAQGNTSHPVQRDESHRHAPLWSREKDQPQAQLLQPQDIVVDDDQDAPLGLQLVQLQDELEELTQTRAQADSLAVQVGPAAIFPEPFAEPAEFFLAVG